MAGGTGDDTYAVDADTATGLTTLTEAPGAGTDTVTFAASTAGVTLDLGSTASQAVAPAYGMVLSSSTGIENAVGGAGDDRFTGNTLVNRFTGNGATDTFVHRGSGGGVDVVTDMTPLPFPMLDDSVLFMTGGTLTADALTINAAATQLRDVATGTFGFDFTVPVIDSTSFYIFGVTDTAPQGQLITFNGAGGFGLGTNNDSLIASRASSGATIGGAGGRDRIIDHSPNGNSLIGRDGVDVLVGGAGADTLVADRGFAPGVSDTITGGAGGDTFEVGVAFGGGAAAPFGADTITDFGDGADTVDLYTTLSVHSGLGTGTVTIWDGATDFGTLTASNGHVWAAGDFS